MEPVRVGVIGCGNISGIYFENLTKYQATSVVAAADIDLSRAQAAAEKYGIPKAMTPEQLLADPDVELVLNLTIPKAHDEVNRAAVSAKKHVYVEKPLAVYREDAAETLAIAKANGVLVGCAPDTFLGGGIQTCRALIDQGVIGRPIGFNAFMLSAGVEMWHPNPEFYYKVGGGPLMDMGPYYLTALVNLMGPIQAVTGASRTTYPQRFVTSEPFNGLVIDVDTPTHIIGLIEFENGAMGQLGTSFDVPRSDLRNIEVYGTEGTIMVPDPNGFGGPIRLYTKAKGDWEDVELTHGYSQNSRGLGVMDMAYAIRKGRPHRASGELAFHVLDAMHAILESAEAGARKELARNKVQPAALGPNQPEDALTD